MSYEDILLTGNQVVVYSSDECLVHVIGGMDKYNGPLEGGVLAMLPTNIKSMKLNSKYLNFIKSPYLYFIIYSLFLINLYKEAIRQK